MKDLIKALLEAPLPVKSAGYHSAQRRLLAGVYGLNADSPLLSNTAFVRLPSESKRCLVFELLRRVRHKYKWMSPRLLHAMAFAPGWFDTQGRDKTAPTVYRTKEWGPLYRAVEISKGNGMMRKLFIPNPPLKYVQRAILDLLIPVAPVPSWLYGFGRTDVRPPGTIYRNAEAHLGQHFLVNFDLRDFFGSVPLGLVIDGLKPEKSATALQGLDARVLITRLCSHRGHLPQGAPTSPLLASLAFLPLDRRIQGEIRKKLGARVVYTRYFDDITVSISEREARNRVRSHQQFRDEVAHVVEKALYRSSFRLNERKTSSGTTKLGHRVTGLRVMGDAIDLPRSTKRRLDKLLCTVQKAGLADAGVRFLSDEIRETERVRNRGSGLLENVRRGRRLASERLAIGMFRHLCGGDLEIKYTGVDDGGQHGDAAEITRVEGGARWRLCERLITQGWERALLGLERASPEEVVVTAADARLVLRAARGTELFLLDRRKALAATELWLQLRGWRHFLVSAPPEAHFQVFRDLARRIDDTLARAQLVGNNKPAATSTSQTGAVSDRRQSESDSMAKPVPAAVPEPVLANSLVARHARQFGELLEEFAGESGRIFDGWEPALSEAHEKSEELGKWVAATWKTIRNVGILPSGTSTPGRMPAILELVRLYAERSNGLRSGKYIAIEQFRRARGGGDQYSLQRRLLDGLKAAFRSSLERLRVSPDEWRDGLVPVPEEDSKAALEAETKRLAELHPRLIPDGNAAWLFSVATKKHLAFAVAKTREGVAEGTAFDWVLQVGEELNKATFDEAALNVSAVAKTETARRHETVRKHIRAFLSGIARDGRQLDLIIARLNEIRARRGHTEDPKKLRGLQHDMDHRLGRVPKDATNVHFPLTPHEARILVTSYLGDLNEALSRLTQLPPEGLDRLRREGPKAL